MTDPQWVAPGSGAPADPHRPSPDASRAHQPIAAAPSAPSSAPQPAPPGQPAAGPPGAPGQAPWAAHPAMEFRPGVIPLRPLNLGDLYGAAIKTIRGNVAATMGLALVTTLVFLVPTTALGAWVASLQTTDVQSDGFPVAGTIGQYLPVVGTYLSGILLTGFVAWVIGEAVQGRKTTAGRTWESSRHRVPQLAGATLIVSVALLLTFAAFVAGPIALLVSGGSQGLQNGDLVLPVLLLVLGAILGFLLVLWLSTRLAFVPAVIVLERAGVRASLGRSWTLTSGRPFWRLLGIRLLTGFIVGAAAQVITVPLALFAIVVLFATSDPQHIFVWQAALSGATGLITGALTTPFTAGVDALLYVDQRIRREGFDVQLITAAAQDAARQWPGAAVRR